jgi:hypothetical protein
MKGPSLWGQACGAKPVGPSCVAKPVAKPSKRLRKDSNLRTRFRNQPYVVHRFLPGAIGAGHSDI